jgi:magnesium transporter
MSATVSTVTEKTALPPGVLIHVGQVRTERTRLTVIDYKAETFRVIDDPTEADLDRATAEDTVTWIKVVGLHQVEVIERLGDKLHLHPLALEDVVNTQHRPKIDEYPDFLLAVLRIFDWDEAGDLRPSQISLILGPHYVITFEEGPDSALDQVQERLAQGRGRIRGRGADYLTYALLDTAIDGLFNVLEDFGERIEDIEEEVLTRSGPRTVAAIHHIKRQSLALRRTVWPMREMIGLLQRGESDLIADNTRIYLRDVYDHTIQIMDSIETQRDILAGLLDVHLSSVSNRLNEIMKVLTIIATIFIPLTFVTGYYGMNFKHMPELNWWWTYPAVFGLMVGAAGLMLIWFRRRRWI